MSHLTRIPLETFPEIEEQCPYVIIAKDSVGQFYVGGPEFEFATGNATCFVPIDNLIAHEKQVDAIQLFNTIVTCDSIIDHGGMLNPNTYFEKMLTVYERYIQLLTLEENIVEFALYICDRFRAFHMRTAAQIMQLNNRVDTWQDNCVEAERKIHSLETQCAGLEYEIVKTADQCRAIEDEHRHTQNVLAALEEQYAFLLDNAKQMARYVKYKQRNLDPGKQSEFAAQCSDEEYDPDENHTVRLARLRNDAIGAKQMVAATITNKSKTQRSAQRPAELPHRDTPQKKQADAYILSCKTDMQDVDGMSLYTFTIVNALPEIPAEASEHINHEADPLGNADFYTWSLIVNSKGLKFPAYYMHVYEQQNARILALQVAVELSRAMRRDEFDRLFNAVLGIA